MYMLVDTSPFELPLDFADTLEELAIRWVLKVDTLYRNFKRKSVNKLGFRIIYVRDCR